MKFGIFDHLDDNGSGSGALFDGRLRLAEAYDDAQRTKHLRFGPLVYLLPFYHPIRLLEEISMLDQLSNGRFQLGIGRGISRRSRLLWHRLDQRGSNAR